MKEHRESFLTNPSIFLRMNQAKKRLRELAWSEFRDRYAPIIAGFARKLAVKPQDIDDIIQDVLLGFFAKSPTFVYDPAKGRFRGYLKVCTFRAMRDRLGKAVKFSGVSIDQLDPELLSVEAAWSDVWEKEQMQRVMEAVRQDYRGAKTFRAFELYAMENQTAEDVANTLEMSVDSVYKAKERITKAIREKLQRLAEEEG